MLASSLLKFVILKRVFVEAGGCGNEVEERRRRRRRGSVIRILLFGSYARRVLDFFIGLYVRFTISTVFLSHLFYFIHLIQLCIP